MSKYSLGYLLDGEQFDTQALDVETQSGRDALHAALNDALDSDASPITVTKQQ